MTKDKIFELIKKYACEVEPKLEKLNLGLSDSLEGLGIDSVSRTEIIMMMMEEVSLDIPRVRLSGASNIGELVDLFANELGVHHGK